LGTQQTMKIETILIKPNSPFSNAIAEWTAQRQFESAVFNKSDDPDEGIDGLVIFSENQELDKEAEEIRASFDRKQKPVHKIDINGTLMVAVSNLDLWFERNGCKKVLMIGNESLVKNPNLERVLNSL
jgi:hypothetical protein